MVCGIVFLNVCSFSVNYFDFSKVFFRNSKKKIDKNEKEKDGLYMQEGHFLQDIVFARPADGSCLQSAIERRELCERLTCGAPPLSVTDGLPPR